MNFTHTLSCLNWTRNLGEGIRYILVKGGKKPQENQKSLPVGSEHHSKRCHFQGCIINKSWVIKKSNTLWYGLSLLQVVSLNYCLLPVTVDLFQMVSLLFL